MQLLNWDCLEVIDNLRLQWIDFNNVVFVSDPPFNVWYHYNEYKDNLSESDYFQRLHNIFWNTTKVIVHYPEQLYKFAFEVWEFPEKVVSWVYNSNTAKQHRDIAFFWFKPDFRNISQPYKNPKDKRIAKRIKEWKSARWYDWWNINQVKNVSKDKTDHPCQMPLEVMENIIKLTPKDKIIIDPFMWSWTTWVACKKLWRDFIWIEISKEYYEIAKARIENTKVERNLFTPNP